MFRGCSSLISLLYISKWGTKNENNLAGLFYYCESLKSLPDISKCDSKNAINFGEMFRNCRQISKIFFIFYNI